MPATVEHAAERAADFELATRCARGDEEAQRELFRRLRQPVHGVLYRLLGSNLDMEDLVQDAFFEIFRSLPHFRGESQLTTWVARIAVRVGYAHMSRRRLPPVRLDVVPELPAGDSLAEERAQARQALTRLYRVLDTLAVKSRVAFCLHVVDGRPLDEVAELMASTLVATKVRVWRARQRVLRAAAADPLLTYFLPQARRGQTRDPRSGS